MLAPHVASPLQQETPQSVIEREKVMNQIHRQLRFLKRQWLVSEGIFGRKHRILRAFMVVTGVILIWRAIWNFFDLYLFPENPLLSSAISLVIGFLLLFIDDFELKELY